MPDYKELGKRIVCVAPEKCKGCVPSVLYARRLGILMLREGLSYCDAREEFLKWLSNCKGLLKTGGIESCQCYDNEPINNIDNDQPSDNPE